MSYAHSYEAVTTYTALLESDESSTSTSVSIQLPVTDCGNGAGG
jgi:hypothetical protein